MQAGPRILLEGRVDATREAEDLDVRMGRRGLAALAAAGLAAFGIATGAMQAQADQPKSQVFKSWILDCTTPKQQQGSTAQPKTFCLIHHEVRDPADETKIQMVARARFLGSSPRKPYFIMMLPPAANLQKGVQLQIDKGTAYQAKIEVCYQQFCQAGFPLSDDLLKQFRTGTMLNLGYVLNPQGQGKAAIPLAGFGSALDALQKTGS